MISMLCLATMTLPNPPLPPLTESYQARPPPPRDGSALLSKRSGMLSSSAVTVGRTAEANKEFASFADTATDAVVMDTSYSLSLEVKPLEP